MSEEEVSIANSEDLTRIDKALYPILTKGVHFIYDFKMIINIFIGSVLGCIIAVGIVSDTDPWRKAYISLSIVIIIFLLFDRYIRDKSRLFDFSDTILSPVTLTLERRSVKVVNYECRHHVFTLCIIIIIELVKLGSGIFCIIDLVKLDLTGTFLNYFLLAFLLLESSLGIFTYLSAVILILLNNDSYFRWLNYMCENYLRNIVNCSIYRRNNRIYMEMSPIDNI